MNMIAEMVFCDLKEISDLHEGSYRITSIDLYINDLSDLVQGESEIDGVKYRACIEMGYVVNFSSEGGMLPECNGRVMFFEYDAIPYIGPLIYLRIERSHLTRLNLPVRMFYNETSLCDVVGIGVERN